MRITPLFPKARATEGRDRRPSEPDEAALVVRRLNHEYIAAVRSNDASWFDRHVSGDAVIILGNGRRLGKPEFLAMFEREPRSYRSLDCRDVTLRSFGSIVQVDAHAPWELGDGSAGISRYIDTYAWLDSRWQVISAQITPMLPTASRE